MKQPFNWTDPDAYEIFMGRWSELLTRPFLAFAGVASGGRVLDVACGTGVLTKALADTGAHVVGVDASEVGGLNRIEVWGIRRQIAQGGASGFKAGRLPHAPAKTRVQAYARVARKDAHRPRAGRRL